MGRCIVRKFQHQRVPLECVLDDAALHAAAATVDETYFGEPGGVGLIDVLFDDGRDVPRDERVEVEGSLNRDTERVLILHL